MSIIHEALKKAASEGTPETPKTFSSGHLFRASVQTPQAYRWIIGILFFVLSAFLFYSWYPASQPGVFNKAVMSSSSTSSDTKVQAEVPQSDRVLGADTKTIDSTDTTLQDAQEEQGQLALNAGIKFYQEGKIEEASSHLKKAVELLPLFPVAHNNLGMVLRHQGKVTEALSHYQEAIRLDPYYAEAENNIGLIYDKTGAIDQAATHYKRAIEIKPTVAIFHLNYATLLERKGDFTNARKEYQIYLDLETDQKSDAIPLVRSHLSRLKGF